MHLLFFHKAFDNEYIIYFILCLFILPLKLDISSRENLMIFNKPAKKEKKINKYFITNYKKKKKIAIVCSSRAQMDIRFLQREKLYIYRI